MAYELGSPPAGVDELDRSAPTRKTRRRLRDFVVVAVGLAAGIAAPTVIGKASDLFDGRDTKPAATVRAERQSGATAIAPPELAAGNNETVAPTPAATPTDAVARFLKAESESDHASSFALLSKADRTTYRSPVAWRAAHATIFPVIGFEVGAADATRPVVSATLRYRSTINEVVGVVPARAKTTWPVVEEDGGWVVDFSRAEVAAELPPDADAVTAASRWATQRQRCVKADEYRAGLIGRAALAEQLCRQRGAPSVGPVARLDPSAATPFVSAFGASAPALARTVELLGPVPMTVVLAPVEDRWLVIGVLDPQSPDPA